VGVVVLVATWDNSSLLLGSLVHGPAAPVVGLMHTTPKLVLRLVSPGPIW
jgi:hypothetical protein